MLEFLVGNILEVLKESFLAKYSWHSNENKLCPSADIFLFLYEREFIESLLSTEKKQRVSILVRLHIRIHQWCVIYEMNFTLCELLVYNDNGSVQTLCITRVRM